MDDPESNINETQHFTYIWTIENVTKAIFLLFSPTFTVKELEMTQWYISITTALSKSVMIDIRRSKKDDGPKTIELKFEISFLGTDGKPLILKIQEGKFDNDTFIGFDDFADRNEILEQRRAEFLPKEALTVRCRMWRKGTEISQVDSCFARTLLRPDRHSFVWAIREFSSLQSIDTRQIILKRDQSDELKLILFFTRMGGEDFVGIELEFSGTKWIMLQICLLDFEGKVASFSEHDGYVEKRFEFDIIKRCRLMQDKASLLPNDVMSLRCEIEMNPKIVWSTIENNEYFNPESIRVFVSNDTEILHLDQNKSLNATSSLTEAMKNLMEEGTFSDVSLRTNTKPFSAHKCILSARSPFFKKEFRNSISNAFSNDSLPTFLDVDEDTLRRLLFYIYTDRVGELEWKSAIDLYRAADTYRLSELKRRCAAFLKSDISMNSVCAILKAADVLKDKDLFEAAQDFVMQQGKDLFMRDTWQNFKTENSLLVVNILEELLCRRKRQN